MGTAATAFLEIFEFHACKLRQLSILIMPKMCSLATVIFWAVFTVLREDVKGFTLRYNFSN